ncbi:hypothetical protein CISG_09440 [Coccidioides immitis RMSCC 3703]|uniref:Uncharacterized protein n=1 Tax=Coccidioides immitis RMSCC 3703 TaxID=454286 RepID=A0A0J8TFR8_COCIT|nr:hypothetical protein CISG_09440 [Coccidioides immitis RMSCC 3703]
MNLCLNLSHITDSKDRSQEEDLGLDSDSDGSPEMQQPGKRFAPNSVREFIENYTFEKVSHEFGAKRKGNSSFQPPIIELHWSESTHHRSRIYVLLVAHTSTGFRLGRDALLGSPSSLESNKKSGHKGPRKSKRKGKSRTNADHKTGTDLERMIGDLVDQCVEDLMYELADGSGTRDLKKILGDGFSNRFLDSFMRDQVVVFQALGKLGAGDADMPLNQDEERDLSLHTRTAIAYILTFNCARNVVEPEQFASHLFDGLNTSQPESPQADANLPDILILALQEIAPIAYAFLGGSYLDQYYASVLKRGG